MTKIKIDKEAFCEEAIDWLGLHEFDYEFVDHVIPPDKNNNVI